MEDPDVAGGTVGGVVAAGGPGVRWVTDLLSATAAAVADALDRHREDVGEGWRDRGQRPGQYRLDVVADDAALAVLRRGGVDVLSEESGFEDRGRGLVVVVDPVDGSTNASRDLPWYATSLCAVDDDGPLAALVTNLATGRRWEAVRGGGAFRDGVPVVTSGVTRLDRSVVVLNGSPPHHLGWRQYRALGASALDLCAVSDGSVDATIDCTVDALGPWDYLGGALLLTEAGGAVADARGRPLVELGHEVRRTPVSAATAELQEAALAARAGW